MTVGDRPVRARRPVIGHAWKWLLPAAAAATAAGIVLAEVLAGHPVADTLAGGPFTQVYSSDGDVNVAAPDPAVLTGPGQLAAEGSVVKIQGSAPACGGPHFAGSGFVYAPQHVLTVAHVLAGTQAQAVTTADGVTYRARVVLYDPRTDVAVLDVPGLNLAPLTFNAHGQPGDDAVVAGYTQGHSFTAAPARIGQVLQVEGPDLYGAGQVRRQIYHIRGDVRLGNFGGPLLSPGGTVDGVILAVAVQAADSAFALTASEIQADASAGAHATVPVSTQRCR
jgi:hypothetical protein